MMEDIDIYADLPSIHLDHDYDHEKDSEDASQLSEKAKNLEKELSELRSKLEKLEGLNNNLKTNFSSLIKTAKKEISRKDRTITELRTKLDNVTFRRNQRQNNRYNTNNYSNGYNNEYNNYTAPEALPNNQLLFGNKEFQLALKHQFSYPPPLLPTIGQNQYDNELLNNYLTPPLDEGVVHTEPENTEKEDFKDYVKPKYVKKESKDSSDEEDEFINKSNYVSTVYGERLRKRLLQEKENEEKKKQEELKLSKEKENEKSKTDNESKIPEENKQTQINKEETHIFKNDFKQIESKREIKIESNKLMQIKEKEIQKLEEKTSTNPLRKESKDFDESLFKNGVSTKQLQRLEENSSKIESKEKELQRMEEEASRRKAEEVELQKLKEKSSKDEIKSREMQRIRVVNTEEEKEGESQNLKEKTDQTFAEIVKINELKSREFERLEEKVNKSEIIESKSFDEQSSKKEKKESGINEDELQNTFNQSQIREVKYYDKRTRVEVLNIVERTNAVSSDSEKEKVNNKENLSFMNKQSHLIDNFVNTSKTEDTVRNFGNSDIPMIENHSKGNDDFSHSREGSSYINNKRYYNLPKSDKYWNSNSNGIHNFKNHPNYRFSKNDNFRHKNHKNENYHYKDYNYEDYHNHNHHERHKNKYHIEMNSRYSRHDYSKIEKYDRHKSSDRSKSRHRESSSGRHRHRECDFDKTSENLEYKHSRTPKKFQKIDKRQKSSEKKKKHKDRTPKKSPNRKRLLDFENGLSPRSKRRRTEINHSVNSIEKNNLIDENLPLSHLLSMHENLLKKKEIYETYLEEGEIPDSLDSVLESSNLNKNNVAKTEANVESIVGEKIDVQESYGTVEKVSVNKERVNLPKTENVNSIIIENITNQTMNEGTSKLEEPKNQETERIESVQEISSLAQQLETESTDSNKLDQQTNPKGDFSEILNSDLQANNQMIMSEEKYEEMNKNINKSIEGKKIKTPKKKTKAESNKEEKHFISLQPTVEMKIASVTKPENNKGNEDQLPINNVKKVPNIQEVHNVVLEAAKEETENPILEVTKNTQGKEVKTPRKKAMKNSNTQEDSNLITRTRKIEDEKKNPTLEGTENTQGKEVKTPRKNVKKVPNIQEDSNEISSKRKVRDEKKNPTFEKTESTKSKEVKTPRKNAKKESNTQEESNSISRKRKVIEEKMSTLEETESIKDKEMKTPRKRVRKQFSIQEVDNGLSRTRRVKDQMKSPAIKENTEDKEVKTPRKNAKKESNIQEDNVSSIKHNDEIKHPSLEKTESSESNQTKTPKKKNKKEGSHIEENNTSLEKIESNLINELKTPHKNVKKPCKHKHSSKKKLKKDEVKNISLEENEIFEDSLVELPTKKTKEELNNEEDKKDNEIKNISLEKTTHTECKKLKTPRKKSKNESNDQEIEHSVLQKEMDEMKNTSLESTENIKDVDIKTHKKMVKKDLNKSDENNDNLQKEENKIIDTVQVELKNSVSSFKKQESKKTQEDPKIDKKQLMKSLFGSDSPVPEKVLDSHSYKKPVILPKNIKNIIFVKRRRRPVQLADSPPVVVVDRTKPITPK